MYVRLLLLLLFLLRRFCASALSATENISNVAIAATFRSWCPPCVMILPFQNWVDNFTMCEFEPTSKRYASMVRRFGSRGKDAAKWLRNTWESRCDWNAVVGMGVACTLGRSERGAS